MDLWLAFKSVPVGVAVAAPVWPMSLLCVQRTAIHGRGPGLVFGAGIAVADFSSAVLGAFGLTAVSSVLLTGGHWLKIAGVLVLLYFAVRIIRARPEAAPGPDANPSWWRGFASAYLLTLANPPTILFFAGLFASIAPLSTTAEAAVFSTGAFAGSMPWWVALTAATAARFSPTVPAWINRTAVLVLIGFAFYALAA